MDADYNSDDGGKNGSDQIASSSTDQGFPELQKEEVGKKQGAAGMMNYIR